MTITFDSLYTAVRERHETRREDWLTAAFHTAETLSVTQCRMLLREVYGKPLVRTDSDIAQVLAARAGEPVAWRHVVLAGDGWQEGRGA